MTEYEKLKKKQTEDTKRKQELLDKLKLVVTNKFKETELENELENTIDDINKIKALTIDSEVERRNSSVATYLASLVENKIKELFEKGDMEGMLREMSPVALMTLYEEVKNADSSKCRIDASRTILYMDGWKPIERSMHVRASVDKMSSKELDAMINSMLESHKEKPILIEGEKDDNNSSQ